MARVDLIKNGNFEQSLVGTWTYVDPERGYQSQYLGGTSQNRVLEMDGTSKSGQVTSYSQSFDIAKATTGTLSFKTGIRTSLSTGAGEGFRVTITDASGKKIFDQLITPTNKSLETLTFDNVKFPAAGTYTIKFTEEGGNTSDGQGALLDDVSLMVCFASGTQILTSSGPVSVEHIRRGDVVVTKDRGARPVRWIGSRHFDRAFLEAHPNLYPIRIAAGALGEGVPAADLLVSPQHRILVKSKIAQRMFGCAEVLVAAKQLTCIEGIDIALDQRGVTYHHMLFDQHEIVFSNGAETESLFTGDEALKSVGAAARDEIFTIFPELRDGADRPAARRVIPGRLARKLAARHHAHGRDLVA
ncbi:Hint domain-containing protein [Paracoccus pacificus]|uniref:Hint domain-containing protein n=1 Tax=Paracoccus pacificus TaxID=1463598 RepID=A0ABW4R625_9RHOB